VAADRRFNDGASTAGNVTEALRLRLVAQPLRDSLDAAFREGVNVATASAIEPRRPDQRRRGGRHCVFVGGVIALLVGLISARLLNNAITRRYKKRRR
jgi:hypothetical protein